VTACARVESEGRASCAITEPAIDNSPRISAQAIAESFTLLPGMSEPSNKLTLPLMRFHPPAGKRPIGDSLHLPIELSRVKTLQVPQALNVNYQKRLFAPNRGASPAPNCKTGQMYWGHRATSSKKTGVDTLNAEHGRLMFCK